MSVHTFTHGREVTRENINVALRSIRGNRLRTFLTILMITVGITAMIGILTATESLKSQVYKQFEQIGAHSFYILPDSYRGEKRGRVLNDRAISYTQAESFKKRYTTQSGSLVTIIAEADNQTISHGDLSTPPNCSVVLSDENYLQFSNLTIKEGRNIGVSDIDRADFVSLIGEGIARKLFGTATDAIGKDVEIAGISYKVIGVITGGEGAEDPARQSVIIPVSNGRVRFIGESSGFMIGVRPSLSEGEVATLYESARQLFRSIRRLAPTDESDFYISYNESIVSRADNTLRTITIVAALISLITLSGASVGLMNIMLVSVKERTSEIGVRKAIGASSKLIGRQFLLESIIIAQVGCIVGILLGTLVGNGVAALMGSPFVVPWGWIIGAVVVSLVVGVSSGYIPAKKASSLDPIKALRYE